jgi:hypothetical protein
MPKPPISQEKIKKIFELRKQGYSIPELHALLGLPKSTLSKYCRKVEILPEFKERWLERRNASKIISERQVLQAEQQAKALVPAISKESAVLIASSLYWAEGAKKDFSLTNSDPKMIKVFVKILKRSFGIKDEDIKISIRLYEDLAINEATSFWSEVVGFDLTNKVHINILKGKKVGKLKYGMCRVRVKKAGLLLKTIFAINKLVCNQISS